MTDYYRVGDRVRSVTGANDVPVGTLGTVVNVDDSPWAPWPVVVVWDFDGYSDIGIGEPGWDHAESELEKVS